MKKLIIITLWSLLFGFSTTSFAYLITNGDFESGLAGWDIDGTESAISWNDGRVKFTNTRGGEAFTATFGQKFQIPLLKPNGVPVNRFRISFDYNYTASSPVGFTSEFPFIDSLIPSFSVVDAGNSNTWSSPEMLMVLGAWTPAGGAKKISAEFSLSRLGYELGTLNPNGHLEFKYYGFGGDAWSNFWIDNVEVVPLPEPGSLVLFTAGLGGLAIVAVRRKK